MNTIDHINLENAFLRYWYEREIQDQLGPEKARKVIEKAESEARNYTMRRLLAEKMAQK